VVAVTSTDDLLQAITPTQVGTRITDDPVLHDGDDDTSKSYTNLGTEDTNYLQWDLGIVKTIWITAYGRGDGAGYGTFIVKVSTDGTVWTDVVRTDSAAWAWGILYGDYRYVRLTGSTENVTSPELYGFRIATLEVFELTGQIQKGTTKDVFITSTDTLNIFARPIQPNDQVAVYEEIGL